MVQVVADTSALADYILGAENMEVVAAVLEHPATRLHIPHLGDAEMASVLGSRMRRNEMDEERLVEALTDYQDLPLRRHAQHRLMGRALELRENFSAYDAMYVALAEQLEASLLTTDARLGRAITTLTSVPLATARR